MRSLIAFLKILGFTLNCLWVIPTQSLVLLFTKTKGAYFLPFIWMNIWRLLFGIKLKIVGTPSTNKQTLFLSNHLSYLDIPALSSIIKASFVAKSEVGTWPLAGFLASLQQTAYIQRKRSKIMDEKNSLQGRVDAGESLVIFPEGTSTSGYDALPFKSSLFMLALGENRENLHIQPISIRLVDVDGKVPQTKDERDIYAWPRDVDIDMHHHLWRFAKTKGATLEITFHTPLEAKNYDNRKVLAQECHEIVNKGLEVQGTA